MVCLEESYENVEIRQGGVFPFEGPGQGRLPERLTAEQVPRGDEGELCSHVWGQHSRPETASAKTQRCPSH